jgi:hypothetical protein
MLGLGLTPCHIELRVQILHQALWEGQSPESEVVYEA